VRMPIKTVVSRVEPNPYKEFSVIGRHEPTERDPNPKLYKMKLFAKNDIAARSRFWYYVGVQKKVKKASGEILECVELTESNPTTIKNYGIFLRYDSRTGTHNLYKEYRDVSRAAAVKQLYHDMAGTYRARFRNISIISVDRLKTSECKRPQTKQFHDAKLKFPLPGRVLKTDKRYRTTFAPRRPVTFL